MLRILITITLLAGGLMAMFFLALPGYEELQRKTVELEAVEKRLDTREAYISNIEHMHDLLEEHEEDVEKVRNALPDDHYIPSLFLTIRDMARQTGVIIDNFGSFSIRPTDDGLREIEFVVEVSGGYDGIKRFIYRTEGLSIENLSRIIEIERAQVSYQEDREHRPMRFNLNLKTYSY